MNPSEQVTNILDESRDLVSGEFINIAGERYYAIRNVDKIAPFFISIVSDSDHWLFVSSSGGLTAGRVSPDTALFPYVSVDKIHDSAVHTGCKTLMRVNMHGSTHEWEPFNMEHDGRFEIQRHLYKNLLGNKLCFEEINHDLQLAFRYSWASSDSYGFVRQCELQNLGGEHVTVDLVDGLQNILPAGTPRFIQTNSSNLVDAYKWTELDQQTGMALFTLNSAITDRPEPCESLRANTVFCLGLSEPRILISSEQLDHFRLGQNLQQEVHKRGVRGAYLVNQSLALEPQSSQHWQLVANIEQSQAARWSRCAASSAILRLLQTQLPVRSTQVRMHLRALWQRAMAFRLRQRRTFQFIIMPTCYLIFCAVAHLTTSTR